MGRIVEISEGRVWPVWTSSDGEFHGVSFGGERPTTSWELARVCEEEVESFYKETCERLFPGRATKGNFSEKQKRTLKSELLSRLIETLPRVPPPKFPVMRGWSLQPAPLVRPSRRILESIAEASKTMLSALMTWRQWTDGAVKGFVTQDSLREASVSCLRALLRGAEEQHHALQSTPGSLLSSVPIADLPVSARTRIAAAAKIQLEALQLNSMLTGQSAFVDLDCFSLLVRGAQEQQGVLDEFTKLHNTPLKRWAAEERERERQSQERATSNILGVNQPEAEPCQENFKPLWKYQDWYGAPAFDLQLPEDLQSKYEAMLALRPPPSLTPLLSKLNFSPAETALRLNWRNSFEDSILAFAAYPQYRLGPPGSWLLLVQVLQELIPEQEKRREVGLILRKVFFMNSEWSSVAQILKAGHSFGGSGRIAKGHAKGGFGRNKASAFRNAQAGVAGVPNSLLCSKCESCDRKTWIQIH